eukprot:gene1893-4622_t
MAGLQYEEVTTERGCPWDLGDLLSYFGAASWFFYAAVALALCQLRRKEPDLHRPFRI